MSKAKYSLLCGSILVVLFANSPLSANAPVKATPKSTVQQGVFKPFTGRVIGNNVRLRVSADVESSIVQEVPKGELFVVVGEKNDFYAVSPPSGLKAYLFRSFVLDNVVEGNRVNIRLEPDLEAPVIGHVNAGTRIDGKISSKNNKWLEISPPQETTFYIAKEYVDYAGGPEYKAHRDKRYAALSQLLESASLMTQSELRKPFEEMDISRITRNYQSVIDEYSEFKEQVEQARQLLATLQETYLQRKIAFLESKASRIASKTTRNDAVTETVKQPVAHVEASSTDRMKIWEPVEEGLYRSWAMMHHAKSMDDYYIDQKLKCQTIAGILEAFVDPVKNKPGDYLVKENGIPVAYVYSTHVNLDDYVGRHVNLNVMERPNHSFAFPAYFVLDVE